MAEQQRCKIQVYSDLHLEGPLGYDRFGSVLLDDFHAEQTDIPVLGDVLCLLGDIGYPKQEDYEAFLLHHAARFELVIVICGNHEYYSERSRVVTHYEEVKETMRNICKKAPKGNLVFLDRSSVVFRGIRFAGCTLWTDIPDSEVAGVFKLGDYKHIFLLDNGVRRLITVDDVRGWHKADVKFIEETIQQAREAGERLVVVTHHPPTLQGTLQKQFENSPQRHGFGTNLEHLLGPPVEAWLFGHTHASGSSNIRGTKVASNQLGYWLKMEHKIIGTGFNLNFMLEL